MLRLISGHYQHVSYFYHKQMTQLFLCTEQKVIQILLRGYIYKCSQSIKVILQL